MTGPKQIQFGVAMPFDLIDDSQKITGVQEGETMTFSIVFKEEPYQGYKHLHLCLNKDIN